MKRTRPQRAYSDRCRELARELREVQARLEASAVFLATNGTVRHVDLSLDALQHSPDGRVATLAALAETVQVARAVFGGRGAGRRGHR